MRRRGQPGHADIWRTRRPMWGDAGCARPALIHQALDPYLHETALSLTMVFRMSGHGEATGRYRERNSTADRALDILTAFSEDRPVMSGNELAERLGVARSTAYRYLQSLTSSRFLEEAPGGGFRLGLRVLEIARVARRSFGLSAAALPVMVELADSVQHTVLLTRRVGNVVVCVERVEISSGPVRISYEPGSTLPINAGASAFALLAWSPEADARAALQASELVRFTPNTVTDVDAVMARLQRIREDGHAVSRAELDRDVLGVAAPIRDDHNRVVAAVSVAAFESRVPKAAEVDLIERVTDAAAKISERMALLSG